MNDNTEQLQLLLEELASSIGMSVREVIGGAGYALKDDIDKSLEDSKRYTDEFLVGRDEINTMITAAIDTRFKAALGE